MTADRISSKQEVEEIRCELCLSFLDDPNYIEFIIMTLPWFLSIDSYRGVHRDVRECHVCQTILSIDILDAQKSHQERYAVPGRRTPTKLL
jgi:hypothetical protein